VHVPSHHRGMASSPTPGGIGEPAGATPGQFPRPSPRLIKLEIGSSEQLRRKRAAQQAQQTRSAAPPDIRDSSGGAAVHSLLLPPPSSADSNGEPSREGQALQSPRGEGSTAQVATPRSFWTPSNMQRLQQLVEQSGEGDWEEKAAQLGT
jgi:hypothetical protein